MKCKEDDQTSHIVRVLRFGDLVFTEHQLYDCAGLGLIGAAKAAKEPIANAVTGCAGLASIWTGKVLLKDFRSDKIEGLYKTRIVGESYTKTRIIIDIVAPPHAAFFFLTRLRRKQQAQQGSIFFLPPK